MVEDAMPATWLSGLIDAAGVFTVVLGALHFFLPAALDYRTIFRDRPPDAKPPRDFRIPLTRYVATIRDRYGIVWIMNHAASYALVSIGLADLIGATWMQTGAGRLLALWIAGWWLIRAASQLAMGRRLGDGLILVFFAGLGLLHLAAALQ
jgi:hypothetical protein